MNASTGEQLNSDFVQSLRQLEALTNQVKAEMTRPKRGREQRKSSANANANAIANPVASPMLKQSSTTHATPKDSQALVFGTMHDYLGAQTEVTSDRHLELDKEFPPLPVSPALTSMTASSSPTSPAAKAPRCAEVVPTDAMSTLLAEFSSLRQLLNTRADALEMMINKNSVAIAEVKEAGKENANQIKALRAAMDNVKNEVTTLKERLDKVESHPHSCNASSEHTRRLSLLEDYSRRWNLILHGVEEKDQEDVRRETIRVLQGILPDAKDKIPGAVDTIHRLGPKRQNSTRSRPIIIQFAYRIHKEAIWSAVKKGDNPFLVANRLKLSLDFSPDIRERRRLLWPQIHQARGENKRAYYVGGRAFVDGAEIFPP